MLVLCKTELGIQNKSGRPLEWDLTDSLAPFYLSVTGDRGFEAAKGNLPNFQKLFDVTRYENVDYYVA